MLSDFPKSIPDSLHVMSISTERRSSGGSASISGFAAFTA